MFTVRSWKFAKPRAAFFCRESWWVERAGSLNQIRKVGSQKCPFFATINVKFAKLNPQFGRLIKRSCRDIHVVKKKCKIFEASPGSQEPLLSNYPKIPSLKRALFFWLKRSNFAQQYLICILILLKDNCSSHLPQLLLATHSTTGTVFSKCTYHSLCQGAHLFIFLSGSSSSSKVGIKQHKQKLSFFF